MGRDLLLARKALEFAADPDVVAILRGVGEGDELAGRAFADRCAELGIEFASPKERDSFLFLCRLWLADAANNEGGGEP